MPFQRPAYPQLLTKSDWDRRKGAIAKMAGKTGVGEAMAKCEKLYGQVKWDSLELSKNPPLANSFTKDDWDKRLESAKSEATGNLRQFVEALYALRDAAKTAADGFERNKLIPSASTQHAREISKTADFLGVSLNTNSIGKPIMDDYTAVLTRMKQVADGIPNILKGVLQRTPQAIAELERMADATPLNVGEINNKLYKAARDVTQNITNIVLFIEKRGIPVTGVDLRELPQLKNLSTTLVTWGNNSNFFRPDAKKDAIKAELAKFKRAITDLIALMR